MKNTNHAATARLLTILAISILFAGCRSDGEAQSAASQQTTGSEVSSDTSWDPNPPGKGVKTPRINLTGADSSGFMSVSAGEYFSFMPPASDTGNSTVHTVENLPEWADFSPQTGEVFGTPPTDSIGEYPAITITGRSTGVTTVATTPVLLVTPPPLGADNFSPLATATVISLPDGYQSIGGLELESGEFSQTFENADLTLEFDEEGNLLDLAGDGDLPTALTDNVSVDAGIRSVVGLKTGAEINADPDFGITLVDDINYLVFLLDAGLDITIGDPDDPGVFTSVTLETPAAGKIILITDPTDHLFYRYGSSPLIGAYGEGTSASGLIPFVPTLDYPGLDTFSGHKIEKGSMGIGFKVFDFFEIEGVRVTKEPQFGDIDWLDPMNSTIEYRSGVNGDANFSFSVLSVGIFAFDLAEASLTLDVGLDRQQAAIALSLDPDESWLPDWFHWVPRTSVTGEAFINGDTSFEMRLSGTWQSTFPEADLAGTILINNDSTTLEGAIGEGPDTLYTSIEFANDVTTGRVRFNPAYSQGVRDDVLGALDREFAELEQAIADLEAAISDYEFEVSLRGLRSAIPAMADAATSALNGIPNTISSRAYSKSLSYMRNKCTDFGFPVGRWCISDVVNEVSVANTVASRAKSTATTYTAPLKAAMATLKAEAQRADDAAFRTALEIALNTAADNYRYSRRITQTYSIPWPFSSTYTVYNEVVTVNVLSTTQRDQLRLAADNVYRIGETSDIVFNTSTIVDALPTQEIIDTVRAEVEAGIAQIPLPDGLGYRAVNDTYLPFIISGGEEIDIAFNVLSPSDVRNGVGDWIADALLGGG